MNEAFETFFEAHRDVANCIANRNILREWATAQRLKLTPETLDLAYYDIGHQLAGAVPIEIRTEPAPVSVESTPEPPPEPSPEDLARIEARVYRAMSSEDLKAMIKRSRQHVPVANPSVGLTEEQLRNLSANEIREAIRVAHVKNQRGH